MPVCADWMGLEKGSREVWNIVLRPEGARLGAVYMFHHTVRRLKIHSKRIFLVVVFGGIYILGVFLKLLTLPYKVISAGTAQHTTLESLFNNIDSDGSIYPPHDESVISQHLFPCVGFRPL